MTITTEMQENFYAAIWQERVNFINNVSDQTERKYYFLQYTEPGEENYLNAICLSLLELPHKDIIDAYVKKSNPDDLFNALKFTITFQEENRLALLTRILRLRAHDISQNKTDQYGNTILNLVVYSGDSNLIKRLLDYKWDIWQVDAKSDSSLSAAAYYGQSDVAAYLLSHLGSRDDKNNILYQAMRMVCFGWGNRVKQIRGDIEEEISIDQCNRLKIIQALLDNNCPLMVEFLQEYLNISLLNNIEKVMHLYGIDEEYGMQVFSARIIQYLKQFHDEIYELMQQAYRTDMYIEHGIHTAEFREEDKILKIVNIPRLKKCLMSKDRLNDFTVSIANSTLSPWQKHELYTALYDIKIDTNGNEVINIEKFYALIKKMTQMQQTHQAQHMVVNKLEDQLGQIQKKLQDSKIENSKLSKITFLQIENTVKSQQQVIKNLQQENADLKKQLDKSENLLDEVKTPPINGSIMIPDNIDKQAVLDKKDEQILHQNDVMLEQNRKIKELEVKLKILQEENTELNQRKRKVNEGGILHSDKYAKKTPQTTKSRK